MISWRKHIRTSLLALGIMLCTSTLLYGQGDPANGEKLFKANCTACHALDKQVVGPPLKGIVDKVKEEAGLGPDWLHKWIKDSKGVIASGDKYANEIFEKYNKTPMQEFPNLSDKDIDDILAYTSNPPAAAPAAPTAEAGAVADSPDALAAAQKASEESSNSKIILASFVVIALLLVWLLLRLKQLVDLQKGVASEKDKAKAMTFGELYRKYNTLGKFAIIILTFFACYGIWNWLMWIGVYKGYQPEQPIHFSHRIHAGENKIDCQVCHSGAKYGKVSEIPSVNVCMNCHRMISEYNGKYMEPGFAKEDYDNEIKKIYEAAGWDPGSQQYTGKTKPIEWTRIHNMPDFVYFNHSQHVVAGEKAIINSYNKKHPNDQIDVVCKACHGKVDTMNVVKMANDFTMGWCIDCHRTTEVDMSNGYNSAYFKGLHDKLKKQYPNSDGKITVDAIGGIECGKCHY